MTTITAWRTWHADTCGCEFNLINGYWVRDAAGCCGPHRDGVEHMETLKPGWQTSEFWLAVAANILGAIAASGALIENSPLSQAVGLGVNLLATLGYTWSRAKAKAGS